MRLDRGITERFNTIRVFENLRRVINARIKNCLINSQPSIHSTFMTERKDLRYVPSYARTCTDIDNEQDRHLKLEKFEKLCWREGMSWVDDRLMDLALTLMVGAYGMESHSIRFCNMIR